MNHIYIVKTISLSEKTRQDLEQEFQTFKINHPIWLLKSFNDFMTFQKSWKNDKYSMSYEDNCYCDTFEEAKYKLINNVCDINDGGLYNYACIVKTPLNVVYASSYVGEEDIAMFKFDNEQDIYYNTEHCNDEGAKFIANKLLGKLN